MSEEASLTAWLASIPLAAKAYHKLRRCAYGSEGISQRTRPYKLQHMQESAQTDPQTDRHNLPLETKAIYLQNFSDKLEASTSRIQTSAIVCNVS